jgi:hypothetical protein
MSALAPEEVPAWMAEGAFWLLLLAAALGLAAVVLLALLSARVARLEALARRLDVLEEMRGVLERLAAGREELDLRRIEHVLVDVREGQKQLGEALLRSVEGRATFGDVSPPAGSSLGERVVNRLHSLGYERVHLVTEPEDVERIGAGDGDVHVEAYRQGVLHKGRVAVRAGRLFAVDLKSVYTAFP